MNPCLPDRSSRTRRRRTNMASKMCSVRILLLTVASAWPYGLARAQSPQRLDDAAIEQRVRELLGQMTLEEKIGQTVHFADSSTGPDSPHADYREQAAQGRVGSFENITGAAETNSLQKLAVENSRLHISTRLRFGRNSRIPHHFPCTAGYGLDLGSHAGGKSFAHRCQGSHQRRHSLDIFANG
jgi:hypothetical protein